MKRKTLSRILAAVVLFTLVVIWTTLRDFIGEDAFFFGLFGYLALPFLILASLLFGIPALLTYTHRFKDNQVLFIINLIGALIPLSFLVMILLSVF